MTTVRAILGKVHRSVITYQTVPLSNVQRSSNTSKSVGKLESETTFKFAPYMWVAKLGINRTFEMVTQGWQAKLHVYKVSFSAPRIQAEVTLPLDETILINHI